MEVLAKYWRKEHLGAALILKFDIKFGAFQHHKTHLVQDDDNNDARLTAIFQDNLDKPQCFHSGFYWMMEVVVKLEL